jgi:hypothetical protein
MDAYENALDEERRSTPLSDDVRNLDMATFEIETNPFGDIRPGGSLARRRVELEEAVKAAKVAGRSSFGEVRHALENEAIKRSDELRRFQEFHKRVRKMGGGQEAINQVAEAMRPSPDFSERSRERIELELDEIAGAHLADLA